VVVVPVLDASRLLITRHAKSRGTSQALTLGLKVWGRQIELRYISRYNMFIGKTKTLNKSPDPAPRVETLASGLLSGWRPECSQHDWEPILPQSSQRSIQGKVRSLSASNSAALHPNCGICLCHNIYLRVNLQARRHPLKGDHPNSPHEPGWT